MTGQLTGQKSDHVTPSDTGRARGGPNLKSGRSWVCAIACLVASTTSHADILMGKVVGVSDGDTITVLDAQQHTHKIRLSGIDAPEKAPALWRTGQAATCRLGVPGTGAGDS